MAFTQRSEETRNAILAAARRRFADDGYERATIRAIAADAGIDPSMVMRYYGSKDGLFAAAVDVALHLPSLDDLPPEQRGETLVRHFLEIWESGRQNNVLTVLLRSAVTNEAAAERMRTTFATQVSAVIGPAVDDGPTRAALVSSQLLGVALCRYILRLPPIVALDTETLVSALAPTVQHHLTGQLA
ncbi:TetR/AcrR family transcriptional regulator [Amycolatopsis taiwanensis]|uniref:TetR family transcriptional regulator n=1 Tax=Amycolatopsis taiwanensis TaxID=342230 RepID=A0A9W6VGM2_9PSEU|nr:TetR family transcriptional regulator [Amycolatopsis taiwanensis]GLY66622.1 TetR family transcriptional regulator [Amycolatopsis taiwanensis]